jgi:ribosomal protein S18 acetylase RimI-like enzyme
MTIVPATPADLEALADMFHADMLELGHSHGRLQLLEVARAMLESEHHLLLVGHIDGQQAGVVAASQFLSIKFPGPALWIEELYVRPEFRRTGLGRKLVEALVEVAEAQGIQGIELEAYRMNTAASVLYRSLGFQRLARERYSATLHHVD